MKETSLVTFSVDRLKDIFGNLLGKRIAVVGDLMVDRYFWGSVMRVSPEAPVPVVEVESESSRLGGAANVGNNISSLGGVPLLIGVIGDDEGGVLLRSLVHEAGFSDEGIIVDASRPTTVKTRVIAHHQHVVRIDQEVKTEIDAAIRERILSVLKEDINGISGIVIQDYNKGVMTHDLIREISNLARETRTVVTVDPKFNNFFEYKNVSVFKPNRKETEEALGKRLTTVKDIEAAGRELLKRLNADSILLTLGEQGMTLVESSGEISHVPTKARKVADVSGAGDTVISTLTMAMAAGASIREAASLANLAGGIVCGEVGIIPIDRQILLDAMTDEINHEPG